MAALMKELLKSMVVFLRTSLAFLLYHKQIYLDMVASLSSVQVFITAQTSHCLFVFFPPYMQMCVS